MRQRVEKLKEQVRAMLAKKDASSCDPQLEIKEMMELVDALQRLGLAYHFDKEINEALVRVHGSQALLGSEDLHVISLRFRLLRQEGYDISSDVFDKFKDADGHFRRSLGSDAKGLLSLYEAAHLGTRADAVLDEAIIFCRGRLEPMLDHLQLPPHLAAEVARALETPLIRRIRRLETRQYLSLYEATDEKNDLVLELAKLDFNLLQSLHQDELRDLTRWWKGLGVIEKLTFARDRLVEGYLWMLGGHYEAHFARARRMMTKVISLLSILDDIYDSYAILEELQLLTDAMDRWDIDAAEGLPEYMNIYFTALTHTVKEFEDELLDEQKSYRTSYLKEEFKKQAKAYFKEAEWRNEGHIPTLEDHLHVSLKSVGISILTCASLLGMGDIATKEVFDWLTSKPRIVEASCTIGRLMGDIQTYEFEEKRQHVASIVHCYTKEYGVSTDIACQKLYEKVDVSWKVMNEEWIQHGHMPLQLLAIPFDLARMIEMYYKHNDGYTHSSEATKDIITSVLVKRIPI